MTAGGCPACGRRLAPDAAWCSACLYVVDPGWRPRAAPPAQDAPPAAARWLGPAGDVPRRRPVRGLLTARHGDGVVGLVVALVAGSFLLVMAFRLMSAVSNAMFNSG